MTSRRKLLMVTFLTFVRFPLVLLFLFGAVVHATTAQTWIFTGAFAALIAAAVTDLFDGYLARKWHVETKFGAHADPLMDKLFYLTSLPLLVFVATKDGHTQHGLVLLVMTVLLLARDQWVTFLRSIGSIYNVSGCANWSGKLRTSINFPLICIIYFFEEFPADFVSIKLIYACEAVALIINAITLFIYTRHYWPYLRKSASIAAVEKTTDPGNGN